MLRQTSAIKHTESSKRKISPPSPAQTYLWLTQHFFHSKNMLPLAATHFIARIQSVYAKDTRLPRNLEIKEGSAEEGHWTSEGKGSMEILRKGWAEGRDKDKKMCESDRLGKKGKQGVNFSGTNKWFVGLWLTQKTDSGVSHTNSLCFDSIYVKFRRGRHDQNKQKSTHLKCCKTTRCKFLRFT